MFDFDQSVFVYNLSPDFRGLNDDKIIQVKNILTWLFLSLNMEAMYENNQISGVVA